MHLYADVVRTELVGGISGCCGNKGKCLSSLIVEYCTCCYADVVRAEPVGGISVL